MLASKFGELSSVPESGIDLEGVHYIVPLTEEGLIFGKKGKSGFFAIKTQSGRSFDLFSHLPSASPTSLFSNHHRPVRGREFGGKRDPGCGGEGRQVPGGHRLLARRRRTLSSVLCACLWLALDCCCCE